MLTSEARQDRAFVLGVAVHAVADQLRAVLRELAVEQELRALPVQAARLRVLADVEAGAGNVVDVARQLVAADSVADRADRGPLEADGARAVVVADVELHGRGGVPAAEVQRSGTVGFGPRQLDGRHVLP